jgi:hypothetical protein
VVKVLLVLAHDVCDDFPEIGIGPSKRINLPLAALTLGVDEFAFALQI